MKSLIIGGGQIGKAVADIICQTDEVIIYDSKKNNEPPILRKINIMHICFPCTDEDKFIHEVNKYSDKYNPELIIIWATVPVGTTKQIRRAVHSPVEGRHPKLASSIRTMNRWVGFNNSLEGNLAETYFKDLGFTLKLVRNSDFTEVLKLLSTTEYGVNIEFARYKKLVSERLGMDYELTKEWNKDYNSLYRKIGMDWAQKYVLDAPNGPIGGHCVVPNARLLQEQFPNELVKIVEG